MKNSSDPSVHRQREQQMIQHVEKLLADERLRVDTTQGRRSVTAFVRDVAHSDRALDLKRLMTEMNRPDRELQGRMPVGQVLDIKLSQTRFLFFPETVGQIRVVCISPTRELLAGEQPKPMTAADVTKALASMPPPLGNVPMTVVLVSTSGFEIEARETAQRRPDRTVFLVEPNGAGGWSAASPAETKAVADLFDPEVEEQKRQRIRDLIEQGKLDLLTSGIATDKLASKAQLPIQMVESVVKEYAKQTPGLSAKRLDGRVVLFREHDASIAKGTEMPFWNTIKELIGRHDSPEKSISRLNMERVTLTQQRESIYEVITDLEEKEAELTTKFDVATAMGQQRIATEIAQLRTDVERRNQLVGAIDKKLNIITAGIHQLELATQVSPEKLKSLAKAAVETDAVDSGLASLDQMNEEAEALTESSASPISDRAKNVLDELRARHAPREQIGAKPEITETTPVRTLPPREVAKPDASREAAKQVPERKRAELESG